MYQDYKQSEIDVNDRLKDLVSKLAFKAINWKIKVTESDQIVANQDLQEIEKILEQIKLYLSSDRLH